MINRIYKSVSHKDLYGGYIALTSVLIIGAVATMIMASVLMLGISYSKTGLTTSNSAEARALSGACAEESLRQLRADSNYTASNVLINLGHGSCSYSLTNTGGTTRRIDASGTVNGVVRKVQVNISALNPKIVISSWQEIQ